jgi:hypothetical protein
MNTFEVRRASELTAQPDENRWLIEGLWGDQAVGIVGGEPKCCKSFLALDVAVAVASGTPCLRRFPVKRQTRVLLFAAEDALPIVRRRLFGIARAAQVPFDTLDVHVITTPTLRLDIETDRKRLEQTVIALQPGLLILDPFVRLHRVDENQAAEVAPLLGCLRNLQRNLSCAVLLVHHARKGAAHARAGQALRGSSELHAWGDSNLYLRRKDDRLVMTVEHRAAPSIADLELELREHGETLALGIVENRSDPEPAETSAAERIENVLATATQPMTARHLRSACRIRMSTLSATLADLAAKGRVVKADDGYRLASV